MNSNIVRRIGYVALLSGLAACSTNELPSDADPVIAAPSSGWLTVALSTPRTDDGAVQLHITGPAIDSATVSGYQGYTTVTSGAADVIVTGQITSGIIARVRVPDLSRVAEYRGTVVAAATRSTYTTRDITNYRVTLSR